MLSDIVENDHDQDRDHPAVVRLIELGRKQGYVTIDDILNFFPEAERDVDKLEEAFAALLGAGVAYVDDPEGLEQAADADLSGDEDLEEEESESRRQREADDNYLANIDTDDMIGLYLKEVGRVPLLTAAEEVSLAKRIEKGRIAREVLASGRLEEAQRGKYRFNIEDGWAAREHLITANSRLVISVAKKYMGRGVPFQDLIQEGNIGLIRAAKKFDYRRGHKFSTYATWWIRQAVTRAIADQGRTIRVPVHMGDQINKLLRVQHQLTQRLGREPSVEELAAALDVPAKKVENMIQVARRPLSLETPTDDEEDSVLGDFIQDHEAPAPDDSATYNLLRQHLGEVLDGLPPREVRILQLRYGLLDGQAYTLEEVGSKMGVTRERVRQIEAQALSRLRHPVVSKKLKEYLGEN
ncbi:MAG: sigma-70 family RNA polymerase sigma factor [Anaerolineales bacterium]|nr:sigma-70 family RNA polymerase sigma factor [Anaerolineales bacterium]QYK51981.1 MAG: sigma-70 family RNA polymerase sigma factor [Anaerolineales bacterium]